MGWSNQYIMIKVQIIFVLRLLLCRSDEKPGLLRQSNNITRLTIYIQNSFIIHWYINGICSK